MRRTRRIRRWPLAGIVLIAIAAAAPAEAAPSVERQRQILRMLRQDCGSCHGLTLRGGLGPALTPQALAGKPPEMLRATIVHGRPGTPMAPWGPFLDESEAAWLVERLLEGNTDAR